MRGCVSLAPGDIFQKVTQIAIQYTADLGQKIQICHVYSFAFVVTVDHVVFDTRKGPQTVAGDAFGIQEFLELDTDVAVCLGVVAYDRLL